MENLIALLVIVTFFPTIIWFVIMPIVVAVSSGRAAVDSVREHSEKKRQHQREFEELKKESALLREQVDEVKSANTKMSHRQHELHELRTESARLKKQLDELNERFGT